MKNPDLFLAICAGIAVELAHLRWIVLNKWTCRSCNDTHLHCDCKPAWVKKLL